MARRVQALGAMPHVVDGSIHGAYEELLIPSAGSRIALSVYRGAPGAPVVVFVPGTMTHPLFYDEFLARLAGAGLHVVGVHPLSHGKSPRERAVYAVADLVENVRDAIRWAATALGAPVVLIGSSQGGALALLGSVGMVEVAGVIAHNVFVPDLEGAAAVGRYPRLFGFGRGLLRHALPRVARWLPRVQVPLGAYLDLDRITRDPAQARRFLTDPLGLRSYPLAYLASLLATPLPQLHDGSLRAPVVVLASTGDRLFSLAYARRVFEHLVAPHKELLVLDVPAHLVFNEHVDAAVAALVPRVRAFAAGEPGAAASRPAPPARPDPGRTGSGPRR